MSPTDPPRRRLGLGLAALGALGAGAAWHLNRLGPAVQTPSTLPADFWQQQLPTPGGETLALARFQGHPLLVNFWASWCPPCVRELPALDRWAHEAAELQGAVLGLAVDQAAAVRDFLVKQPVNFPVLLAGPQGLAWCRALGNASGGLPFSLLIAPNGKILAQKLGALADEDLSDWRWRLQAH
jgi:thiol-disulfide isomerase/thioredoxin